MTYEEIISSRESRAQADKARRAEWLKSADIDQMETDALEAAEIAALGSDE